jgi:hypothetical protein
MMGDQGSKGGVTMGDQGRLGLGTSGVGTTPGGMLTRALLQEHTL